LKISRVFKYGSIIVVYLIILHIIFPSWLNSPIKQGIFNLFNNFYANWTLIFPFIGIIALGGLVTYYGLHFLASFGKGYKAKGDFTPNISILIASKDERPLLGHTLNSIINSEYPKDKYEIIIITSGSSDNSTEFCEQFAKEHNNIEIKILSDHIEKKGKPAALNYGLKHIKYDICVFYDAGIKITPNNIKELINPLQDEREIVTAGPVIVDNYNDNYWTRGILIDYSFLSGGSLYSDVKNKLGSSCYLLGRNFCIRTKNLLNYNGFNEDALTEDLYLTVLLNLDGIKIRFVPNAKAFDIVPNKWKIIKKQRLRWVGGYVGDAAPLMELKKGNKSGAQIIISRNLSMLFLAHIDIFFFFSIPFAVIFWIFNFYYLLMWTLSFMIFTYGFLINGIRKYGEGHYLSLFWMPVCSFIHLWMFTLQFRLPKEISWEKTPVLLKKDKDEIENLIEITNE